MRCLSLVSVVLCSITVSCEPGGVGDPCVPEDEYQPQFAGYALGEVNVESRSFSCETRICLVNHFQGRVSCPHGQAAPSEAACHTPGSSEVVETAVEGWDLDRPAEHAVYCSCRCDGPDANVDYCECPSGFVCRELVPELGFGKRQLEGSYCVRRGTEFHHGQAGGETCRSNPEAAVCQIP